MWLINENIVRAFYWHAASRQAHKESGKEYKLQHLFDGTKARPFNKVFQSKSSMDGLWNEVSGFSQDTACNEDSNGIFHVIPKRIKTRL